MNTTIYSISESPRAAGQIWVGTDDGNVQLTRDGGRNWTNVTANLGMPAGQLDQLGRGEPLRSRGRLRRPTTATLTATCSPISTAPTDYGRTWQRLIGPGHAGRARLRACHQGGPGQPQHPLPRHRVRPVHVRRTAASRWAQFKPNNFPDGVAVRDIALQEREDDLVLATHGRGIWVIDDISPLRALTPATLASARDADPRPARSSSASRAMAAGPRATPPTAATTRRAARPSLTTRRRGT